MEKCGVSSVRKRYAGSTAEASAAWAAKASSARLVDSLAIGRRARDIFQEQEIGRGPQADAGQRSLRDRVVRLVPEADVRHFGRDELLHLGEQPLAFGGVGGPRGPV